MSKILPYPSLEDLPMVKIDFNHAESKLFRTCASGKAVRFTYDYKIKQIPNDSKYELTENGTFYMKVI